MAIAKNSPELWDKIWEDNTTPEQYRETFNRALHSIRWRRIEALVKEQFGSFKGLKVIEIGAGQGTFAALMALQGAKVTLLDYSDIALKKGEEFFAANNLQVELIKADALKLPDAVKGKFDISVSLGLNEHFLDEARVQINKSHFEVLKKGGLTFISVPNKLNLPYRWFKFYSQKTNNWPYGEEYPYTRGEFVKICRELGIRRFGFIGESVFASFTYINPLKRVVRGVRKITKRPVKAKVKFRNEVGTPLDSYFGYALVLWGEKD